MKVIGNIFEASYRDGLKAFLSSGEDPENYPLGSLSTVVSGRNIYLCILSDLRYSGDISLALIKDLPEEFLDEVIQYLRGNHVLNTVQLIPIARYSETDGKLGKPDTIPPYGSKLVEASGNVLSVFYGEPDYSKTFPIGQPKIIGDVKYEVPVNIPDLFNLSFGIYGKSGSGKTFIANLLVGYGLMYRLLNRGEEDFIDIRFLIFDMHDEYSKDVLDSSRRPVAKGIANIFRREFDIYSPDIENVIKYNMEYLPIPLYNISTSLLRMVVRPLGVTQVFLDNLHAFEKKIRGVFEKVGDDGYWVLGLLLSYETLDTIYDKIIGDDRFIDSGFDIDKNRLSNIIEAVEASFDRGEEAALKSLRAGRRRLMALLNMPISFSRRVAYTMDKLVESLVSESGNSVVISMGRYEKTMPVYLAIANIIGEKLRLYLLEKIREGIEELPSKIIILLEEAHKFLGREIGYYSPFGNIAREMRKRGVIVIPIDQKPGELDPDVTSMIWTNIIFALTDKRDVDAVLIGLENPRLYENIVYSLRQGEALIYGPAVRFPVVLNILDYSVVSKRFAEFYEDYMRKSISSLDEDDLSRD